MDGVSQQVVAYKDYPPKWTNPASKQSKLSRYFSDRNGKKKKVTVVIIGALVFLATMLTVGYFVAEIHLKK